MSQVVGLPSNSYKPITNTAKVRARLCKLQKMCTRFTAASDKVFQLLAHGRWFSPASFTTQTGRNDIAEILLKVALNTINQSNLNQVINQYVLLLHVSAFFFFYSYRENRLSEGGKHMILHVSNEYLMILHIRFMILIILNAIM